VNHYQRLKVAHDAPAEVIRAAYRALATRVHPDRQSAATSPDDLQHIEMAALNVAYETLIDPKLRADYDATLAPNAARANPWSASAVEPTMGSGFGAEDGSSKVDLDWLSPAQREGKPGAASAQRPDAKALVAGGAAALVVLALGGAGLWHVLAQRQVDEVLTRQYHDHDQASSGVVQADGEVPDPRLASTAPSGHKPSVDELSRMSDEELLKVLPTLDDEAPAARRGVAAGKAAHHPLDGTPLNLKVERNLVDPLAEPPVLAKGKASR
jgi:curved DNA-binding protein CbpA